MNKLVTQTGGETLAIVGWCVKVCIVSISVHSFIVLTLTKVLIITDISVLLSGLGQIVHGTFYVED